MVVGPIIAHVSVNNNLPFENKGNRYETSLPGARGGVAGFLPQCYPVADYPRVSMLHQKEGGALSSPNAFYVR
jgi:hypothetical protein